MHKCAKLGNSVLVHLDTPKRSSIFDIASMFVDSISLFRESFDDFLSFILLKQRGKQQIHSGEIRVLGVDPPNCYSRGSMLAPSGYSVSIGQQFCWRN